MRVSSCWCSVSANASILCIWYIDYVQVDRCEYCNVSDSEWKTSVCTFPNFVEEHTSPCGIEFGIRLDALIGAYSGTTCTRYYINRWSAWNSLHHNYFGIMSTASIIVMHSDTLSRWLTCICEQRNFSRCIECKTYAHVLKNSGTTMNGGGFFHFLPISRFYVIWLRHGDFFLSVSEKQAL